MNGRTYRNTYNLCTEVNRMLSYVNKTIGLIYNMGKHRRSINSECVNHVQININTAIFKKQQNIKEYMTQAKRKH